MVARRVILRWDETPSRLRRTEIASAETLKVVQCDVNMSELLQKGNEFKAFSLPMPSVLVAVDRTTAACLCAVLELQLSLLKLESHSEPLEVLGVTDMAPENACSL